MPRIDQIENKGCRPARLAALIPSCDLAILINMGEGALMGHVQTKIDVACRQKLLVTVPIVSRGCINTIAMNKKTSPNAHTHTCVWFT